MAEQTAGRAIGEIFAQMIDYRKANKDNSDVMPLLCVKNHDCIIVWNQLLIEAEPMFGLPRSKHNLFHQQAYLQVASSHNDHQFFATPTNQMA